MICLISLLLWTAFPKEKHNVHAKIAFCSYVLCSGREQGMKAITWCPTGDHPINTGVPNTATGPHVQSWIHSYPPRPTSTLPSLTQAKEDVWSRCPLQRPGVTPVATLSLPPASHSINPVRMINCTSHICVSFIPTDPAFTHLPFLPSGLSLAFFAIFLSCAFSLSIPPFSSYSQSSGWSSKQMQLLFLCSEFLASVSAV